MSLARLPHISTIRWFHTVKQKSRPIVGKPLQKVQIPEGTWSLRIHSQEHEKGCPPAKMRELDPRYPLWSLPTKGILSKLPPRWVPYAELSRIEKPGGLYGFYMAYLIGIAYEACVATPTVSPITIAGTAGILLIYNIFLRGAACTINDILDRGYDRQVARCRSRPVARGAVTPYQAYVWYAMQTLGAGAALACLPNPALALTYAIPIQAIVSLYPLSKRYTDFPQLVLSIPIAGGVLMSAAIIGMDPWSMPTVALTAATAFLTLSHYIWTIIFDYVNACQDTVDDIKAGVHSMAVRYQNTSAFISILGTAQVGCLAATGIMADFSSIYFVGAAGGNSVWLLMIIKTDIRSRPDICAWWFSWGGLLVSGTTVLALMAEYYTKHHSEPAQ
ncbi:UbiA prenyltransferase family-domain-containing protein [Daldinia grandis]|nr:UbiA prenyltransferase family-domain-containing protein [Daldinia grandis]